MTADVQPPGPPPALRRPEAMLFDWDNTLIDSWHAILDAQNHTLEAFGLAPWTLEETRQRVRGSMRDSFPALFGARWREAGEVFYRRFTQHHMESLKPLPGAETLLHELYEQGTYLAVVSNKKGDYLRREAEHLGWTGLFGRIVGAFDAARDKPAVDPVHLALEGSGYEPGESVWFAGDADVDLECAVNAGCVPVLVRAIPPNPGEFEPHPPAVHVDDCMMLLKVIQNL
ncbi:MAG: HAD family hydrolase [Rhodospirillales bacterium]|nr:HAD family hydrolase [Rhodospirillales bacterium]